DIFALYMYRLIGFDFVEEIARARAPTAARLSTPVKHYLGVGNESGIGMVAALVRWPHWLSAFCFAREFCLGFALSERKPIERKRLQALSNLLQRAARYYRESDRSVDPAVEDRKRIAAELTAVGKLVSELLENGTLEGASSEHPFAALLAIVKRCFSPNTAEQ